MLCSPKQIYNGNNIQKSIWTIKKYFKGKITKSISREKFGAEKNKKAIKTHQGAWGHP